MDISYFVHENIAEEMCSLPITVGSKDCPISQIIACLKSTSSFHLFRQKLADFMLASKTPREQSDKWRRDYDLLDKLYLTDVVVNVVEDWVSRNGSQATLQELIRILEEIGLVDCAESLEKTLISRSTSERKFCRSPTGLEDFISAPIRLSPSICIIFTPDISLTCAKILGSHTDCHPCGFEDFLKIISSPQHLRSCDQMTYLVDDPDVENVRAVLRNMGNGDVRNKTVIVTKDEFEETIRKFAVGYNQPRADQNQNVAIRILKDKIDWDDLTPFYKFSIKCKLENSLKIKFQDEELSDILHDHRTLVNLINGNELNLFCRTAPKRLGYYINRSLLKRDYITTKLFDNDSRDIFLFTGMERYELSGFLGDDRITDNSSKQIQHKNKTLGVQYMILDNPAQFEKICSLTYESVHWLHFRNKRFRWIRSKGRMELIQKCVDGLQDTIIEENFLNEIQPDSKAPICICDSPGMGKSIFLEEIRLKLYHRFPDRSVLFIPFNLFITELKSTMLSRVGDSPVETERIYQALQNLTCANRLEHKVLWSRMMTGRDEISVELLLDGFDEISSTDYELGLGILEGVVDSVKCVRIWITTRPHLLHDVEDTLKTLGYTIQPFTLDDQIRFLTSYWSRNQALVDKQKFKGFASHCLDALSITTKTGNRDIAGIPLQCLMIADVYEEEATAFANNPNDSSIEPILIKSVADLYKTMIDRKLRARDNQGEEWTQRLFEMHIQLALELIYPKQFPELEALLSSVASDTVLRIGIVEASGICGGIGAASKFLHRTFAEYFLAWFLIKWLWGGSNPINDQATGIASLRSSFTEVILGCQEMEINVSHLHIKSWNFIQPVIAYFIDALILEPSQSDSVHALSHSIKSEVALKKILHGCINSDLAQLHKFLMNDITTDRQRGRIINREFVFLAVQQSTLDLCRLVIYQHELCHELPKDVEIDLLRVAVKRGEFSIVEYLIKGRKLRNIVSPEQSHPKTRMLMHDCVKNSKDNPSHGIGQRRQIIGLLLQINETLMEEKSSSGCSPLLSPNVHPKLILELVEKGANLLTRDRDKDTVLHLKDYKNGRGHLTKEEYHSIVEAIPEDILCQMINFKGYLGATPLYSIILFFDPSPQTLMLFEKVGADFNCVGVVGHSLLTKAIKCHRNGHTLRRLIELGARADERKGWKRKSNLHTAAENGHAGAVAVFLEWVDKDTRDWTWRRPMDYARKYNNLEGFEKGVALWETKIK